jgi:hypothetical protein
MKKLTTGVILASIMLVSFACKKAHGEVAAEKMPNGEMFMAKLEGKICTEYYANESCGMAVQKGIKNWYMTNAPGIIVKDCLGRPTKSIVKLSLTAKAAKEFAIADGKKPPKEQASDWEMVGYVLRCDGLNYYDDHQSESQIGIMKKNPFAAGHNVEVIK